MNLLPFEANKRAAAKHWLSLQHCANQTSGPEHGKYLKAIIEFTECYAILTGQPWISADTELRQLSKEE